MCSSSRRRSALLAASLSSLLAACSGGSSGSGFRFTSSPGLQVALREPYAYTLATGGASGVVLDLAVAPPAMTLDAGGTLHWTPDHADLGVHTVRVEATAGSTTIAQEWDLRVHQGADLGTGLSPRNHVSGSSDADYVEHFSMHAPWGRVISFHMNWRDDVTDDGELPLLAEVGVSAAATYGFTPVLGIGWSDGEGVPDLTSESEPLNDSWTNAETRAEFLAMVTSLAATHAPPYLFLGNEVNSWYEVDPAGWDEWLDVYAEAYDAVKAASPTTRVFTVFQFERLAGLGGARTGWTNPARWELLDDVVATGRLDLLGFTTYPYFEYSVPADLPADLFAEVLLRWSGPVAFTEVGWNAAPFGPYPGSEPDQAAFVDVFFDRTQDLDVDLAVWLFLHDFEDPLSVPPFTSIGLRSNDGATVRTADARWQDAVLLRQR